MNQAEDRFQEFRVPLSSGSKIQRVIAVASGKGGVGKSTVTSLLAVALKKAGYSVGILDADITGPSIPHCFGVEGQARVVHDGLLPAESETGIRLMSMNLLLSNTEAPALWRGPVIANVLKQFWSQVLWGKLDFLLLDMPPGTGDVPLSVYQMIRLDGVLMVTTPQSLVKMIVQKALNMADAMEVPVLGVIENETFIQCPHCDERIPLFGRGAAEAFYQETGLETLAQLPLDPRLTALCDAGAVETAQTEYLNPVVDKLRGML